MSTELTVLNNQTTIQEGGLGVDFGSKLFKLKPATLTIVQPQSTVEGALKGHLRISETGDQFKEMYCALLGMPSEQRQWHIGEPGEMNRTPENLMCFSTDMIKPHVNARMPQAIDCAHCSKSDWTPYRAYRTQNNGKTNKKLLPSCDAFYRAFLIDTVYQLPLKMFIRSKAKTPFEQGMQNIARTLAMAKAQKKNPNIFDVKFKLSTKLVQDGKYSYYVPVFSEPKFITDDERQIFGDMYLSFTQNSQQKEIEDDHNSEIESSQTEINKVVEGEYIGDDNEIII